VTGDAADSDDLTQETFKRVYLHIGTLDDPSRFTAWLKKIMIRVYHDWLRNDRWRGRLVNVS
jgi:DNA-directed RNA polymerase specialized sigma24 family protein